MIFEFWHFFCCTIFNKKKTCLYTGIGSVMEFANICDLFAIIYFRFTEHAIRLIILDNGGT